MPDDETHNLKETGRPSRVVFFGSGAFGLPTFHLLCKSDLLDMVGVVSQPDRRAGRGRKMRPTPIAESALAAGLQPFCCEDVNQPEHIRAIHSMRADVYVVIAFGQKLSPALLSDTFAINLHGSLLPRYRGAAPIHHAIMNGDALTGVSVITLSQKMDGGKILGISALPIGAEDTTGAMHDRLSELGPDIVLRVLQQFADDTLEPMVQDETQVTRAPKLSKRDGVVDFSLDCDLVRARVHGLNPWPGCSVLIGDKRYRLGLVEVLPECLHDKQAGMLLDDAVIACGSGAVRILMIQPPGGKMMPTGDFLNSRTLPAGQIVVSAF